tara:strand:+ start:214 stop:831 length:618 start_codon:yes stop_codon:yes gene_type:complete
MKLKWNLSAAAAAFGMNPREYWSAINGNSLSKISEHTIAQQVGGEVTSSQEEYDVITPSTHWASNIEVRNCFKKSSFAPSTSTGKGRFFEESAFQEKLEVCDSYVFIDLNPVRNLQPPVAYEIPTSLVKELYEMGALGAKAHIDFASRKQYNKGWNKKPMMRFEELFPYKQFRFRPGCSIPPQYNAQDIYEAAIERINLKRNKKK